MTTLDRHAIGNLLQVILRGLEEDAGRKEQGRGSDAVFEIVELIKPKGVPVAGVKVVDGKLALSFEMGEL